MRQQRRRRRRDSVRETFLADAKTSSKRQFCRRRVRFEKIIFLSFGHSDSGKKQQLASFVSRRQDDLGGLETRLASTAIRRDGEQKMLGGKSATKRIREREREREREETGNERVRDRKCERDEKTLKQE